MVDDIDDGDYNGAGSGARACARAGKHVAVNSGHYADGLHDDALYV